MSKSEIIILIREAKRQHRELTDMRAYFKADQLKGKIKLLKKKLRE